MQKSQKFHEPIREINKMKDLPLLTEVLAKEQNAAEQFKQLAKILLRKLGDTHHFQFKSCSANVDSGIDGVVWEKFPGIQFSPIVFHIKWLNGPINKPPNAQEIQNAFQLARESAIKFKSYVLVIPRDISLVEATWLKAFERDHNIETHHIGFSDLIRFLDQSPALFKLFFGVRGDGVEDFKMTYTRYVNSVAYSLQYLEFIGLPTGQYQRQDLLKATELTKVYISINFKKEKASNVIIELPQIIKQSHRCVVLGDPGSGKSTLAKYLALIYSRQLQPDSDIKVEERVPLIIHIRDFVRIQEAKTNQVFDFIDYLKLMAEKNYHIENIDKDFFIAQLEMGKAIVLFDGLDEVTSREEKIKIAEEINVFSERYPDSLVWVTSRIFGYTEEIKTKTAQFDHYYIAPVSEEQANTFIERWYKTQIPTRKNERERRIASLKKAVKENVGVRRLQKNPLLLTMMTLVHQFEGTLPDDRGRLYEKCVDLLLNTWQEQKYVSQGEDNPLEKRNIRLHEQLRLLAAAAIFIQKVNENAFDDVRGLINERLLENVLFQTRYDPSRIGEARAREDVRIFINYLRDRVGLFVEVGTIEETNDHVFSFIHLSFLEYLCAYQLSEDRSQSRKHHIQRLLNYIKIPSWEEIILLTLYIFSKSPGGNLFIDQFCQETFNLLDKESMPECWILLGKAVRDNISFALVDMKRIINELVKLWVHEPTKTVPMITIKEIIEFSPDGKIFLKEILTDNISSGETTQTIASLYLLNLHFFIDADIVAAIENNSDKAHFFPYLPAFRMIEPITQYMNQNLDIIYWNQYYNSTRDHIGRNLDQIINYRSSTNELTGYILSSWSTLFASLQERKNFLKQNEIKENDRQITSIYFDFGYATFSLPLTLFKHYLNTLEAYLDTPGNIQLPQLKENKVFELQEKTINDHLNPLYISRWVSDILELKFKDMVNKLPVGSRLSAEDEKQLEKTRQDFSWQFSEYLSGPLVSHMIQDFSKEFSRILTVNLTQEFNQFLYRNYGLYLSQDYKRDTSWHLSKTFSRFLDQDYSKKMSLIFLHYFQPFFTEDIFLDFFKNQHQRFETQFKEIINNTYEMRFKKQIDWNNLDDTNLKEIYSCFGTLFKANDTAFCDSFTAIFYHYLLHQKVKILFTDSFLSLNVPEETSGVSSGQRKIKITRPFVAPYTFDFILAGAINHYIIKILAHLNQLFFKNESLKPNESLIRDAVDAFCARFPFQYYIIRNVWDIYSVEMVKKLIPANPLNNLRLACFITNAAKASLLTDKSCTGGEWNNLIKIAEKSEDDFVRVSHALYKIVTYENRGKNSTELYTVMREFKENHPQLFEMIGFK